MIETQVVRLSKKGQFVIPKGIREALGIKEGDELMVGIDGDKVVLTPSRRYARSTKGMLKGTWGRTKQEIDKYLEKERAGWD